MAFFEDVVEQEVLNAVEVETKKEEEEQQEVVKEDKTKKDKGKDKGKVAVVTKKETATTESTDKLPQVVQQKIFKVEKELMGKGLCLEVSLKDGKSVILQSDGHILMRNANGNKSLIVGNALINANGTDRECMYSNGNVS